MRSSILFIYVLAIVAAACGRQDADKMLADDKLRGQLFSAVVKDHRYLSQLMDSMRLNGHAAMMMANDSSMHKRIFQHSQTNAIMHELMARVEADSITCKEVCSTLMDNPKTMRGSVSALKEKGMMSKGCMMDKMASAKGEPPVHKH